MNSGKKILIYLSAKKLSKRRLTKIYETFARYHNSVLVVEDCAENIITNSKAENNIRVINVKNLITQEFLNFIDDSSLKLSEVVGNIDKKYLKFKNIKLGDIIDHSLYGYYFDILEDLFIIDKLIRIEEPDVVLKYSDYTPYAKEIKEALKNKHNIDIKIQNLDLKRTVYIKARDILISLVNVFSLFINLYTIRDILKFYYYKRNKHGLGRGNLQSTLRRRNGDAQDEIQPVIVIDNPNSSCIDTVMPIINRLEKRTIVTDNFEVIKACSGVSHDRLIYLPMYKPLLNVRYCDYLYFLFDFKRALNKQNSEINGYNLSPFLHKKLKNIFLKDFPKAISSIAAMEMIIKRDSFNFIVLPGQCNEFEEVCIRTASMLRIPSLVIQHGIAGRVVGFIPINTTKIALWGARDKEFFEINGADMNKVAVVGCPRFDSLINNSFDRSEIFKKYGLPDKKVILVATTQMFAEYSKNDDLIIEVLKLLSLLKNIFFIIKPHPNENENKYGQMLIDLGINNGVVMKSAELNELIFISEFVITYPSTVPIHIMALDKPFVLLYEHSIYSKYKKLVKITDVEEVGIRLKPLLSNTVFLSECNSQYLLNDFLYGNNGQATDRVIELINQMHLNACYERPTALGN